MHLREAPRVLSSQKASYVNREGRRQVSRKPQLPHERQKVVAEVVATAARQKLLKIRTSAVIIC